jgi:hypothetical protein
MKAYRIFSGRNQDAIGRRDRRCSEVVAVNSDLVEEVCADPPGRAKGTIPPEASRHGRKFATLS